MNAKATKINPAMGLYYKLLGFTGFKYETDSAAYIFNPFVKKVILFEKDRDSVWSYEPGHYRYDYLSDYVKRGSEGKVRKYSRAV